MQVMKSVSYDEYPISPTKTCLSCGYVLDGLAEHRCPECGHAFDPNDGGASFGPSIPVTGRNLCLAATVGLAVILASIGLPSLMKTLHIPAGWASTACSWLIVAGYLWQSTVLILCRIEFRDRRFGRVPPRPLTVAIGLALLPFLPLCVVCILLVMANGVLLF